MTEGGRAILVMGVSGIGKSTLGRALAERLGYSFIEGDDLHPAANVRKMAAGIPLDDEDRWPWLERVADVLGRAARTTGGVVSCSALKRSYRDLLRRRLAMPLTLIYPVMGREELRQRLVRRNGHYMPASLLDSQFATLQPPAPDEGALIVPAELPVAGQVEIALSLLNLV